MAKSKVLDTESLSPVAGAANALGTASPPPAEVPQEAGKTKSPAGSPNETTSTEPEKLQPGLATGILPATHWAQLPLEDEPPQEDNASVGDQDSAFGDAASSTASLSESILEYRNIHGRTFHSNVGVAESW